MRWKVAALAGLMVAGTSMLAAQDGRPTFRQSVDRVTLSVTVRTSRGRHVANLKSSDFKVYDNGVLRPIAEFRSEPTPVSLAFLVDYSGSMDVAARRAAARDQVRLLLDNLTPSTDRAALYVFDKELRALQTMAPVPGTILAQLDSVQRPYGVTSLFDAIAATGRELEHSGGTRRAVVAITDGADNASTLSPEAVSTLASGIDVPVYVVVVVSPFDRAGHTTVDDERLIDQALNGPLANLAHWTGGEIFVGIGAEGSTKAAMQLVTELRQQYVIAFEPGRQPGWHPIEVRTSNDGHVVRTRNGYVVGDDRSGL